MPRIAKMPITINGTNHSENAGLPVKPLSSNTWKMYGTTGSVAAVTIIARKASASRCLYGRGSTASLLTLGGRIIVFLVLHGICHFAIANGVLSVKKRAAPRRLLWRKTAFQRFMTV